MPRHGAAFCWQTSWISAGRCQVSLNFLLCLQERASAEDCKGEQHGGPRDAGGSPIDAFAWGSIVLENQLEMSGRIPGVLESIVVLVGAGFCRRLQR